MMKLNSTFRTCKKLACYYYFNSRFNNPRYIPVPGISGLHKPDKYYLRFNRQRLDI